MHLRTRFFSLSVGGLRCCGLLIVGLWFVAWNSQKSAAQEATLPEPLQQFSSRIDPLLRKHCGACHGKDEQEGGISFSVVKPGEEILRWRSLWKRSLQRVEAGEMPPEGAEPILPLDRQLLIQWLQFSSQYIHYTEAAKRDPGPTPFRRLTRTELNNTVRDLLNIPFDAGAAVGVPEDGGGESFENLAASLQMAPSLLEKYFAASDKMIDQVFAKDGNGERARQSLFIAKPDDAVSTRDAALQVLTRVTQRAYRRTPSEEEMRRVMHFFDRAIDRGEPFEQGVQEALKPILLSPRFLFRIEEERVSPQGKLAAPLDDFELAVRLSYFLWSSMPDDALLRVAAEEDLQDPAILRREIKRMLADRKAYALTENFATQWLQIKKLDRARPSTEFFPTFTGQLKHAMRQEMLTFWDKLRTEDRSVLELLDANYTYVNETLAAHYGMADVKGDEFRKVTLRPEDHRGGILGMAGALALTSHTFRTSPTQRGKYVLEVIFGTPPPPPPPNAGSLPEPAPGETQEIRSLRDQLAQHATQASCAGCHRKIDPLGFALDNYNAIGAWRESTAETPLDVSGILPTGEKIQGVEGLKTVLRGKQDEFARNVAEKLLVYALGRELDYFDDSTVQDIVQGAKQDDFRFSRLIEEVAFSVPFRNRRGQNVDIKE